MTYPIQAGRFTLTFKSHAHADEFADKVTAFLGYLPDSDAYEYAQRIAWRYYAEPVKYQGLELDETMTIPHSLWVWMKENWVTDTQEAAA